ncbi:MAG: GDSL-type esterase/lipase family protein [Candidatus Hydrogenedentes bacterium]|nr:GDSL-type esterase/lipase family protein [Candidatus Hydrogenedentota bacterium]
MQSRKFYFAALAIAALVCSGAAQAQLPNSIAGLGDSITRAALSDNSIGGLDYGQPQHSWSTGYEAGDGVTSHYERILAANPSIGGNTFNLAESGAQMDDLPGQANAAVSSGAQYVVIQMGGNDVCADSTAQMTTVASYTGNFTTALNTLQAGLPDATILVTEVVRVKRVYDVGRFNLGCLLQWGVFQWCDNVLRNGSTQRNAADARNIEYNNVLRGICAQRGLPFDDDVFEWQFSRGNLSDIDCFHPDKSGQHLLANITYDASRF